MVDREAYGSNMTFLVVFLIALLSLPRSRASAGETTCFLHYAVIETRPSHRFKLPPGNQCSDYCKYLDTCHTFSFQLDDLSICNLYREQLGKIEHDMDTKSSTMIIGWKDCLLGHSSRSVSEDSERWKEVEDGLMVIQKLQTGSCVRAVVSNFTEFDSRQYKENSYPLYWTPLCDGSFTWELMTFTPDTEENVDRGCKQAVFRLKNTFLCLTAFLRTTGSAPKAFLKKCSDEVLQETSDMVFKMKGEYQLLLLCPEVSQNAWSVMLYRSYDPKYRPVTLAADEEDKNPNLTLMNISLTETLDLVPSTAVSACKHVEVKNGSVQIGEGVPLFLPGEKITVRCEEGFGVGVDHVIRQEYVTSCSEDLEVDLCTAVDQIILPPDQLCSSRRCFMCRIFVFTELLLALVALLF